MSNHSYQPPNAYRDAAKAFIQQIGQHNPCAAAYIERIEVHYGTRAAYLAGFALVNLLERESLNHFLPSQYDLSAFTYCDEMRENAEAMRLYLDAAGHLFPGMECSDGLTRC